MPLEAFSRGAEGHHHAGEEKEGHAYDRARVGQFLKALNTPKRAIPPEGSRIVVHAAVSRFAALYERIRNAVEYREDHLLRKGAIQRILGRQLVLERDPFVIANHLIRELIGARYLPNEALPETLIDDTAMVVRKYQAVVAVHAGGEKHARWLLGVLCAELEELLADPAREKAIVTFLYEQLADKIRVRSSQKSPTSDVANLETERKLQIYVACYRSLVKADDESAGHKLLRAYLPEWMRPDEWTDDPAAIRSVAERLVALERHVRERLRHPLSQRFLRAVKPWAVSLEMLTEAALEEHEHAEMLTSPEDTHIAVEQVIEKREKDARGKLRRGTIRAMIYLFLTKMIFALVIELPVETLLYGEYSRFALGVNLLFPPVLMFFVGVLIRRPGADNRQRILRGVDELLSDTVPAQDLRAPRKRRGLGMFLLRMVYAITFIITFGAVGYVLWKLDFTWVATLIFFFFLCVVSFFGYRLRQGAREILVVQPRERLTTTILDFFSFPILRVGQRLSQGVSRLNVFVFIFDFLVEAPFKLLLAIMEDWLSFMREKKEELTEE